MVLPLLVAVIGVAALVGLFAVIIEPLAILTGVFAAAALLRELTDRGVTYGLPGRLDLAVNVGLSAVTGFVTFKVLGAAIAAFGILAGLALAAGVWIFGASAVAGSLVFISRELLNI